ncbi:MAG: undecaprenyl-diphosphate phosphatase [Chthoniobacter sp.]|nr:undecaprenyl-diphosphate phosphatase [Chthoniobacter sp.]
MTHWLIAVILGLIEGITEFIPISSTGHLLLAEQFLTIDGQPIDRTFFGSEVFNAVIQCGAMLAALPLFSARLATLKRWQEPACRDYFLKLLLAFGITGVGAFTMKKLGLALPHTVTPIALALLIGGVLFVVAEFWVKGRAEATEITWTLAVAFGLAQLVAVAFPGASRSGSTILFALLLGLGRGPATEFSFLLGVPTLCAAGAKTMFDALKHHEVILWQPLLVATVVAAVASVLAVKWLLGYLQSHTFTGFGIYRIAFGVGLLLFVHQSGAH